MPADQDIAALFLANQSRIYGFICSLVVNRADAEDLLQETGLVIFRRADDFEPGTNFLAWACRIAKNKVLNFRTTSSRSLLRFGDEFINVLADRQISLLGEQQNKLAHLSYCLEKLSAHDRNLVEVCYAKGATIKQSAEQAGRPANVIYKRMRQIRELLRDCMQKALAAEANV